MTEGADIVAACRKRTEVQFGVARHLGAYGAELGIVARVLYWWHHTFKLKINVRDAGLGRDLKRVSLCALVIGEIAGPEEGGIFCAISPALPILHACSPTMSLAGGSSLTPSMMMNPPTSLKRRRLLDLRREVVCEGGGDVGGPPRRPWRKALLLRRLFL